MLIFSLHVAWYTPTVTVVDYYQMLFTIFSEFQEKVDVTVNEEADTITYYLRKVFTFNAELSGCRSEDDDVIILNPGMVVSQNYFNYYYYYFYNLIQNYLKKYCRMLSSNKYQ